MRKENNNLVYLYDNGYGVRYIRQPGPRESTCCYFFSSSSSFRFVLVVYSATVEKPKSIVGTREKHTDRKNRSDDYGMFESNFSFSKESNSGTSFDVSKKMEARLSVWGWNY